MTYKWEKESLEKYGEEVTLNLIKRQKEYEEEEKDNNCDHCGKGNEGVIVELKNGTPTMMHCGLWVDGICKYCGEPME